MTDEAQDFSLRKLYLLTAVLGLVGTGVYFWIEGIRSAMAFLLGALASCGNLWLFEWVSGAVSPAAKSRKPWQAGAYIIRYILLVGVGYAIVKALNVSALAVVLGLLASAAAVLASLLLELLSYVLRRRTSH